MTRQEFQDRLDECMLLLSDPDFPGVRWMTKMSEAMWSGSVSEPSWFNLYQPLAATLYRLGLIGCAPRAAAAPVFYAADPLLMDSRSTVEGLEYFFIHRMLHKALDVRLSSDARLE